VILCVSFFVMCGVIFFADKVEANAIHKSRHSNSAVAFLAFQKTPVLPEDEEEIYKLLPFYIVAALLILALPVEIYFIVRKRKKEKLAKGSSNNKPQIFMTFKEQTDSQHKKKHLSKSEMSELLKASASEQNLEELNDDEKIWELKEPALIEPLQQTLDSDGLYNALLDIGDENSEVREKAANILAKYNTQNSVFALTNILMNDANAGVKVAAIHSLKQIAHESVFPALFVAMAEEEVNVRSAAIEALNELKFEVADNVVRIIKSDNDELIKRAAEACIKTGLAKKSFAQLTSSNKKNIHSSIVFLSLLAHAGETKLLLDAISNHEDVNVRVLCVRIMNEAQRPENTEQLRNLSEDEGMPSVVRSSLMQAVQQHAQA